MIHDIFPFHCELEILKARLTELDPVVGRFYVVECVLTHKGDPKPLYFADNRSMFDAWSDKIEHVIVDDPPRQPSFSAEPPQMFDDPAWKREWFQMDRAMSREALSLLFGWSKRASASAAGWPIPTASRSSAPRSRRR